MVMPPVGHHGGAAINLPSFDLGRDGRFFRAEDPPPGCLGWGDMCYVQDSGAGLVTKISSFFLIKKMSDFFIFIFGFFYILI